MSDDGKRCHCHHSGTQCPNGTLFNVFMAVIAARDTVCVPEHAREAVMNAGGLQALLGALPLGSVRVQESASAAISQLLAAPG